MIRQIAITIAGFLAIAILSIVVVDSVASGMFCIAQPDQISIGSSVPTTATDAQKEVYRNGPPSRSDVYNWDLKFVTLVSYVHANAGSSYNGKRSGRDWHLTTAARIPTISLILMPLLYPFLVLIYKPIRPKGTLGKASIQILLFISLSTFFFWLTTIGARSVTLTYRHDGITYYRCHPATLPADILKTVPQSTSHRYDKRELDIHVLSYSTFFEARRWQRAGRPGNFPSIINTAGVTTASDWNYSIVLRASPLFLVFIFAFCPVVVLIRGPLRRHRRRRKGLCLKCGYNLTGNESGVCPECGEPT